MVLDLNSNKKFFRILMDNMGIGKSLSLYFCYKVGLNENSTSTDVSKDHIKQITKLVAQEATTGVELKRRVSLDIGKKVKLRTYQGIRHTQGLPVRGQNTKNNASTSRRLRAKI